MQTKISVRRTIIEPATRITLPKISLDYGIRRKLSSLVPQYIDPQGFDGKVIPPKIYFVHMAIAIKLSYDDWLMKVLLEHPDNLPLRDEVTGINLLHIAAKSSPESTLTILLQNYNIIRLLNESDLRGITPLIVAAWNGNFAALKYFLALGCETTSIVKDTKKNALHCAADLNDSELCSQLLKYNSNRSFIDAIDYEGNTPLLIAVRGGSPCVNVLLKAGASYIYKNEQNGRNILHLAIVFFQNDTLIKLVQKFSHLISTVDLNGDNPFMLAIKSKNNVALKILIKYVAVNKLLENCTNCIHYLIKHNDTEILNILMSTAKNVDFLEWIDDKGRTPLMCAVEIQNVKIVAEILLRKKSLIYRNTYNGETVLHIAAYVRNEEIMNKLLNLRGVEEIIDVCDYGGRTAYEIVLGRGDQSCYHAIRNSGYVPSIFFNSQKESSLFIAAKLGNYNLVLNILFSEKFLTFYRKHKEFTKLDLMRAKLQGVIYSSDIYIICGETLNDVWNRVPDQSHLFQHNIDNKNIFHACVIGESLWCLVFVYSYCIRFNDYWRELDLPDNEGTTPLLYATKTGQDDVCKFLVQHGANIISENSLKEYPLQQMTEHIPYHRDLFLGMINECVVEDTSKKQLEMSKELTVSCSFLCPAGIKQMSVLNKIYKVFDKEEHFDILQSAVLEYFIEIKWLKLKSLIALRFYVNILFVLCIYTYMSLTIWWLTAPMYLVLFIWITTILVSVISVSINIPHLFIKSYEKKLFAGTTVVSPLCTVMYVFLDMMNIKGIKASKLRLEVGALAVLSAGISIFVHAIDTPLGQQISMFYEVLSSIIGHLPLGVILLVPFSICFFVIFHQAFNFNNPFQSFLYTAMVLLGGDSENFPTFNNSSSLGLYNRFDVASALTAFVEGFLLISFKLFVTLALLNMLIGLSVRGARELEKGGNVQRLKTKVAVLWEWESFSHSKFYKWLSKYHLCFIFGLKPNLIESLEIPSVIYPLENPVKPFDMNRLQNIAIKKENIPVLDMKFLYNDIGYREKNFS